MAKVKKVRAWVAVPVEAPHRIDAGYWIEGTRKELRRIIDRESAMPNQWTERRVEIIPTTPKKKARRK